MGLAKPNLENQLSEYIMENKEKHYRLAFSYVRNPEDALDIVQESIYKALASISTLREPSHIHTWFYKIIVNTSLGFLRKKKKLVTIDDDILSILEGGNLDKYENLDLKEALKVLPEHYRSIIILRYFEDFKIDDVAEILGENVNTIKTRLYKSLKTLRIKLEEEKYEK